MLNSEIEISLLFHRLPDRIRAPARTCFLALTLYLALREYNAGPFTEAADA